VRPNALWQELNFSNCSDPLTKGNSGESARGVGKCIDIDRHGSFPFSEELSMPARRHNKRMKIFNFNHQVRKRECLARLPSLGKVGKSASAEGAVRPWTDGGGWMLAEVCCRTTPSAKADTPLVGGGEHCLCRRWPLGRDFLRIDFSR
jgi:hypothetical protein